MSCVLSLWWNNCGVFTKLKIYFYVRFSAVPTSPKFGRLAMKISFGSWRDCSSSPPDSSSIRWSPSRRRSSTVSSTPSTWEIRTHRLWKLPYRSWEPKTLLVGSFNYLLSRNVTTYYLQLSQFLFFFIFSAMLDRGLKSRHCNFILNTFFEVFW